MKRGLNILITGASSGIGAALAVEYAQFGAKLFLLGRNAERLEKVAAIATEISGQEAVITVMDVTNKAGMDEFIHKTDNEFPLDIVIANAGISGGIGGEKKAAEISREIFEINYHGVLSTIFPASEAMKKRENGQIAVVSSIAGFCGLPSAPAYSASKAAVNSYCDAIRPHLLKNGIHLTLICPGFIDTPLVADNPFPMPMIMSSAKAAKIIRIGISQKKKLLAFPFAMFLLVRITSVLPAWLKDILLGKYACKEPV